MSPSPTHLPPRALGYMRVSTSEQVGSGAGLAAQESVIVAAAERNCWELELVVEQGLSAKDLRRPALQAAMTRLDAREADILVVSKLDRLSRSVVDFGRLLDRAKKRGWSVVCLDLGMDSTTPAGELMANVVASTAQYERRLIGQRTKDALAARKAAGVRLGRPQTLDDHVVLRILAARQEGSSIRAIAAVLTADGVPTARGGSVWSPSSVQAVLLSQRAVDLS